jgi:hypothetical protein
MTGVRTVGISRTVTDDHVHEHDHDHVFVNVNVNVHVRHDSDDPGRSNP